MSIKNFIQQAQRISKVLDKFPGRAAVIAVNFSKERFRMKNWVNRSREPWKKISPTTRKNYLRGRRKVPGSLMLRSGRLKRSIRKLYVSRSMIIIGTDVPYAKILNDGGHITNTVRVKKHTRILTRGRKKTTEVKAHTRKMNTKIPPRRFIGPSDLLMRRLERHLDREFKKILQ